jgi:hypothetical protein
MKGVMDMRKLIVLAIASLLFFGFSGQSMAGIHIGVNIPLPPIFTFSAPPELVVIPGTYVYYDPDVDFNLFFYAGYWYRPYEGYWYRSVSYEGPWVYIGSPPYVLLSLPLNYRIITRGYRRIPYWELHRNWQTWQRDRYWAHHNWGRPEYGREHGLVPGFREREYGRFGGGIHGRMEHQREHGLAPFYRGGEHRGYGGGVRGGEYEGRGRR